MKWVKFKDKMPNQGQRIIVVEDGYGAFDDYFSFDSEADYSNCIWCEWPFPNF